MVSILHFFICIPVTFEFFVFFILYLVISWCEIQMFICIWIIWDLRLCRSRWYTSMYGKSYEYQFHHIKTHVGTRCLSIYMMEHGTYDETWQHTMEHGNTRWHHINEWNAVRLPNSLCETMPTIRNQVIKLSRWPPRPRTDSSSWGPTRPLPGLC